MFIISHRLKENAPRVIKAAKMDAGGKDRRTVKSFQRSIAVRSVLKADASGRIRGSVVICFVLVVVQGQSKMIAW